MDYYFLTLYQLRHWAFKFFMVQLSPLMISLVQFSLSCPYFQTIFSSGCSREKRNRKRNSKKEYGKRYLDKKRLHRRSRFLSFRISIVIFTSEQLRELKAHSLSTA